MRILALLLIGLFIAALPIVDAQKANIGIILNITSITQEGGGGGGGTGFFYDWNGKYLRINSSATTADSITLNGTLNATSGSFAHNVSATAFQGLLDCTNITGAVSDLCTITAGGGSGGINGTNGTFLTNNGTHIWAEELLIKTIINNSAIQLEKDTHLTLLSPFLSNTSTTGNFSQSVLANTVTSLISGYSVPKTALGPFLSNTSTTINFSQTLMESIIDAKVAASGGAPTGNTTEEIQDASWSVLPTGEQVRITVTYQDGTNDVDFVVDDLTAGYNPFNQVLNTSSAVTFSSVTPGSLLSYYSAACSAGQYISDIADDGTYTCSTPTDTTCNGVVCDLSDDTGYDYVDLDFTGTTGLSDGVDNDAGVTGNTTAEIQAVAQDVIAGYNPFDQVLNTTSDVTFDDIVVSNITTDGRMVWENSTHRLEVYYDGTYWNFFAS